jgi:hypothetical protein
MTRMNRFLWRALFAIAAREEKKQAKRLQKVKQKTAA